MKLKNLILLLIIVFYFAFFVFRSEAILDPDFGWHLQYGRLVIKTHTIPVEDTYSYTMPSYHFINHEWGSGVLIASIYDRFGMLPLIIIFSLVSVSTLYFLTKGVDAGWAAMPLFLAGGTILEFMGVRPQMFTWVFAAFLATLLWQKRLWQRWRFFIPLLFLLWANLHAGFCIGIFMLGWFVFGEAIEHRHVDKKDILILLFSLLATLCNPFGYHLWVEVMHTVTDQDLHFGIQEWYPAIYFTNIAFWIYVVISLILVLRYRRKFSMTAIGIYFLLLIAGLSSMRNIPIFVVVSFYPTVQAIKYFYEEAGNYLYGKERFVRGYIFFFIIALCFYLPQLGIFTYGAIKYGGGQSGYPAGAVSYLRNHLPRGNIFASYDWGGYLIWQLPEKKDFIDGRMPTWQNPNAPSNESTYAFGDYLKILGDKIPFSVVSKKYDIDTVLVSTNDLKEQDVNILGINLQNNPFFKRFFTSNTSFFPIVSQVKKMGWKEVYHDKTATIFEKLQKRSK